MNVGIGEKKNSVVLQREKCFSFFRFTVFISRVYKSIAFVELIQKRFVFVHSLLPFPKHFSLLTVFVSHKSKVYVFI